MKKSLALLLGAMVPTLLMVGACGDDVVDADGVVDPDADSGRDATTLPPRDSGGDARTDARSDADAQPDPDGGDAGDADAADAADGDAGEEPQDPRILTFVNALAAAACTKYESCCAGLTTPGAGKVTCAVASQTDTRFFGALLDAYYYSPAATVSNRIRIDQALADSCLVKVGAMSGCLNVGLPATEWKAILQDCSQALYGIGDDGDSCASDLDCDKNHACIGAVRGGAPGLCEDLRGPGDVYTGSAQDQGDACSYRGYGFGTDRRYQPESVEDEALGRYKCFPQQDLGEPCVPFTDPDDFLGVDQDCKSYACGFNDDFSQAVCVDQKIDLFYCDQYLSAVP